MTWGWKNDMTGFLLLGELCLYIILTQLNSSRQSALKRNYSTNIREISFKLSELPRMTSTLNVSIKVIPYVNHLLICFCFYLSTRIIAQTSATKLILKKPKKIIALTVNSIKSPERWKSNLRAVKFPLACLAFISSCACTVGSVINNLPAKHFNKTHERKFQHSNEIIQYRHFLPWNRFRNAKEYVTHTPDTNAPRTRIRENFLIGETEKQFRTCSFLHANVNRDTRGSQARE